MAVSAEAGTPVATEVATATATIRPSAPIFLLCGPRPAGLSAVGYEVHRQLRLAGLSAAYLDLEQVGFLRPARADDRGNHRFKAANLAAVYRTFQDCGTDCLVAVGSIEEPGDDAAYAAALPDVPLTSCRANLDPDGRPVGDVAREILAELAVPSPRP